MVVSSLRGRASVYWSFLIGACVLKGKSILVITPNRGLCSIKKDQIVTLAKSAVSFDCKG